MRVAEPGDREANILFDEVREWFSGALPSLIEAKLLRELRPSHAVVCRGCEKRCLRPVDVVHLGGERPPLYVSTCETFPDMGPFDHSPSELKRWATSREMIARFVGRRIALNIRSHDENWRRVLFSTFNLHSVKRALSIEFETEARLKVGGVTYPLVEVLTWDADRISVDLEALAICAAQSDDVQSGGRRLQPSRAVREANKVLKHVRDRRLQQSMDQMAKAHTKLSKDQLADRLARTSQWRHMKPGTIARLTRKPRNNFRRK